jgi:hypothetical protein
VSVEVWLLPWQANVPQPVPFHAAPDVRGTFFVPFTWAAPEPELPWQSAQTIAGDPLPTCFP